MNIVYWVLKYSVRSYLFSEVVQNLISHYIKWGLFEYACIILTGLKKSEPIKGDVIEQVVFSHA